VRAALSTRERIGEVAKLRREKNGARERLENFHSSTWRAFCQAASAPAQFPVFERTAKFRALRVAKSFHCGLAFDTMQS
jgi:hypothetical protein